MVECFHATTIDVKHLHFRCEQYCILPLRNKSFPQNPGFLVFVYLRKPCFLILGTRSSIVLSNEARRLSLEVRVSSVNLLLSVTLHEDQINQYMNRCFYLEEVLEEKGAPRLLPYGCLRGVSY